mgnify:CR=1 FL=1
MIFLKKNKPVTPGLRGLVSVKSSLLHKGKPFSGLIRVSPFNINGSKKTRKDIKTETSDLIFQKLLLNMSETTNLFSMYLSK